MGPCGADCGRATCCGAPRVTVVVRLTFRITVAGLGLRRTRWRHGVGGGARRGARLGVRGAIGPHPSASAMAIASSAAAGGRRFHRQGLRRQSLWRWRSRRHNRWRPGVRRWAGPGLRSGGCVASPLLLLPAAWPEAAGGILVRPGGAGIGRGTAPESAATRPRQGGMAQRQHSHRQNEARQKQGHGGLGIRRQAAEARARAWALSRPGWAAAQSRGSQRRIPAETGGR